MRRGRGVGLSLDGGVSEDVSVVAAEWRGLVKVLGLEGMKALDVVDDRMNKRSVLQEIFILNGVLGERERER